MKGRVLTAGTTFLLAAAMGHFMQSGSAGPDLAQRVDQPAPVQASRAPAPTFATTAAPASALATTAAPTAKAAVGVPAAGGAPRISEASVTTLSADTTAGAATDVATDLVAVSASPDLPAMPDMVPALLPPAPSLAARMQANEATQPRRESAADKGYDGFGQACPEPAMSLSVKKPAVFAITLTAPCNKDERVVITHAGLSVAYLTDDAGQLSVLLPALDRSGAVAVRFASGAGLKATRPVPGIDALMRVAVSWAGPGAVALSAYEGGAAWGGAGHVHPDAPGSAKGPGGVLTLLGDPASPDPLRAQVYSAAAASADVRFDIEAEVSPDSCGRPLDADIFRVDPAGLAVGQDLTIAMPACDAVGDLVVMDLTQALAPTLQQAAAD
jgi:hypothetical protein